MVCVVLFEGKSPLKKPGQTKELARRRVAKVQSANQNKGVNNDVQIAVNS